MLKINNRSKTLAFKGCKHLLYIYYPKFIKTFKNHPNKFDMKQFFVLLYDCVPNMNNNCSIDKLLQNINVLQVGTGKNPTTALYSETKKGENILNEKNIKITKREHAFKGFASTYNVEILNYLKLELQLKYTESVIKSKLIELLTHLKGFKFMTTLVLVFEKIESGDKIKYDNFYSSSKAENESTLMTCLNQSILQL